MTMPIFTKRFPTMWAVAAGVCMLFSMPLPCSAQDADSDLKWQFREGDRFLARLDQKTITSTTVDRRTVRLFSNTTVEFEWVIQGVEQLAEGDGGKTTAIATIEQTIRSIRLEVENPEFPSQAISLDTGSQQRPRRESLNLLRQVEPLIGLKFVVKMTDRGKLMDLNTPPETLAQLGELPESLKLQELFSPAGLSGLLEGSVILLPNEPQTVGSQWEISDSVGNPFGRFARSRKYHYTENEARNDRRFALIKLTTEQQLEQRNPDASGTLLTQAETGTMTFNLTDGYFTFSEIKSEVATQFPYVDEIIKSEVQNTYTFTLDRME